MTSNRYSLFLVVLLAACGGSPAATDAGSTPDDGGGNVDAANDVDTGTPDVDTGTPDVDAGTLVDAATDVDAAVDPCAPHTFVVTTPGSAYSFDGGPNNATLTLCAGVTYMFDMSVVPTVHPMEFRVGAATVATFAPGITTSYTVPAAAAEQPDAYVCTIHLFGGAITIM